MRVGFLRGILENYEECCSSAGEVLFAGDSQFRGSTVRWDLSFYRFVLAHVLLNPYWIVASYVACLLHPTQMRILSFDNPRLASISDPARSIPSGTYTDFTLSSTPNWTIQNYLKIRRLTRSLPYNRHGLCTAYLECASTSRHSMRQHQLEPVLWPLRQTRYHTTWRKISR